MTTTMFGQPTTTNNDTTPAPAKPHKGDCGCGCGGKKEGCGCKKSCCSLTCFERPNYFCGHLLTDADLSLEQKYLVEKNKLYHRAIDGHGVVCGLRLTCDDQCNGYVDVGEGYAIDNCGNDLIVCDTQRVDVLRLLKDKGWIADGPQPDPCKPGEPPDDCPMAQCFRLAICYEEEPADFTTPFSASCGSGPAGCEPTRTRERVRFDVLQDCGDDDKPLSRLEQLEVQMERCYAFLSTGAIGRKIRENQDTLQEAVGGKATATGGKKYFDLFCQLNVLFLQYLKCSPEHYDCTLEEKLRGLKCPKPEDSTQDFSGDVKKSYSALLGAMQSHAFNCIINELVFSCDQTSQPCCVVLGSVEVMNGRITRVCNLPREYVWTPANFVQVLLFNLLTYRKEKRTLDTGVLRYETQAAPGTPAQPAPREKRCCPDFPFNPDLFLRHHSLNSRYGVMAAHASIFGIREAYGALARGFDFTNPELVSAQMAMQAKTAQEMAHMAEATGFQPFILDSMVRTEPNAVQALFAHTLKQTGAPMAIYADGVTTEAWPAYLRSESLDYDPVKELQIERTAKTPSAEEIDKQIDAKVTERIREERRLLKTEIERLSGMVGDLNAKFEQLNQTPAVGKPAEGNPAGGNPAAGSPTEGSPAVAIPAQPAKAAPAAPSSPAAATPQTAPGEKPKGSSARRGLKKGGPK